MTAATRARVATGVLVFALIAVLAACTGDASTSTPSGASASSGAGQSQTPQTLGALADSVLDAPFPEPVAEQDGTVLDSKGGSAAGAVSVVTLNRGAASTVLLLKLSTQGTIRPANGFLSADEVGGSANGVHVTVGEQDFYPGSFTYGDAVLAKNCVCTGQVRTLGPEGVWISAEFGQVPEGTTTATLTVPGFETFEVPVTSEAPAS